MALRSPTRHRRVVLAALIAFSAVAGQVAAAGDNLSFLKAGLRKLQQVELWPNTDVLPRNPDSESSSAGFVPAAWPEHCCKATGLETWAEIVEDVSNGLKELMAPVQQNIQIPCGNDEDFQEDGDRIHAGVGQLLGLTIYKYVTDTIVEGMSTDANIQDPSLVGTATREFATDKKRIRNAIKSLGDELAEYANAGVTGIENENLATGLTVAYMTRALYETGHVEPEMYLLFAALYAAAVDGKPRNADLVRFYELQYHQNTILLEADLNRATAVQANIRSVIDPATVSPDADPAPGDLVYAFSDSSKLQEGQVTDMLAALEEVALEDMQTFKNSEGREKKVKAAILKGLKSAGFGSGSSSSDSDSGSDGVSSNGAANSGVYWPSDSFQTGFAKEVAKVVPVKYSDIVVTAVLFWQTDDDQTVTPSAYKYAVIYTAKLEKERCFVCDTRAFTSSETDSEEGSEASHSSSSSGEATNFREFYKNYETKPFGNPGQAYNCAKSGEFTYRGYTYPIHLSQFSFIMPCGGDDDLYCGSQMGRCPNFIEKYTKYKSEFEQDSLVTGSAAVEGSKKKGDTVVDVGDVPGVKFWFEQKHRAARQGELDTTEVKVDGTTVTIPLHNRKKL